MRFLLVNLHRPLDYFHRIYRRKKPYSLIEIAHRHLLGTARANNHWVQPEPWYNLHSLLIWLIVVFFRVHPRWKLLSNHLMIARCHAGT